MTTGGVTFEFTPKPREEPADAIERKMTFGFAGMCTEEHIRGSALVLVDDSPRSHSCASTATAEICSKIAFLAHPSAQKHMILICGFLSKNELVNQQLRTSPAQRILGKGGHL
jgi:hypothetical protein